MYDPIALLLMIRVNRESMLLMSRKRLPALDAHFDRVNLLLWPRLKVGEGCGPWALHKLAMLVWFHGLPFLQFLFDPHLTFVKYNA